MREKIIVLTAFLFTIYFVNNAWQQKTAPAAIVSTVQADRLISLSPSNTEILFALGAGAQVVGVTTYCDYPPEALVKDKIGSFYSPDIEKIVKLKPDLVLANSSLQAQTIMQLQRVGINVLAVDTQDLDTTFTSISLIADAIGRKAEGEQLLKQMSLYRVQAQSALQKYGQRKKVFIEVWDKPILTVGSRSYLNELIKAAGGDNVAEVMETDYIDWDLERIYTANPDVYLRLRGVDMGSKADVLPDKLKELPAVKNGRVVTVFGDWIVRPGPRSFEALPKIMQAIYEEGSSK